MINLHNYVNENKTEHNKNWPYIPDHPCKISKKSVSKKKSTKELNNNRETKEEEVKITAQKKRYISPEEKQQIIEELKLPKKDAYFRNY